MTRYIIYRIIQGIFTLWAVVTIVFFLSRATGDPATLLIPFDLISEEEVAKMKARLGLDASLPVQYGRYLLNIVQGDFGISTRWVEPALPFVMKRFLATAQLVGVGFAFAVVAGISTGTLSAIQRDGWFDNFGKAFALLGQAAPTFWVGLMGIVVFAVFLGWLPSFGKGDWRHLILPALTLGWYSTAALTRLSRSAMLDVLEGEYIRMLRIKGVPEFFVIGKHAMKNAAIPVLTLAGLQLAALLNGAVVTETVFGWPGIGATAITAINARDFPVVQVVTVIGSVVYVAVNIVVDILYAYLDPRIRYT